MDCKRQRILRCLFTIAPVSLIRNCLIIPLYLAKRGRASGEFHFLFFSELNGLHCKPKKLPTIIAKMSPIINPIQLGMKTAGNT